MRCACLSSLWMLFLVENLLQTLKAMPLNHKPEVYQPNANVFHLEAASAGLTGCRHAPAGRLAMSNINVTSMMERQQGTRTKKLLFHTNQLFPEP